MATFIPFQDFKEQIGKGVHNLDGHTLRWALTNTAPNATDTILANITQIAAGNGYTTGGLTQAATYTESAGTGTLNCTATTVFTASGGTMATFRYAVLYNDTATSPADALIGYIDHGSAVSLTDGNTYTIDGTGSGALTIA